MFVFFFFLFLMIRRPPKSTHSRSSAASDVYKRQHSIKRYVNTFGRMLLLISHGITDNKEISRLLVQSERLTKEYLELYEKYKKGDHWPEANQEFLEQLKVLYPAKKKDRGGKDAN